MGLFDFFKSETRSAKSGESSQVLGVAQTNFFAVGEITEEKIMKIPTAKACVDKVAGTIAPLPIYLYKEHKDGSTEKIHDERVKYLNDEPNDFIKGHNFKRHMVKDLMIHGTAYTYAETLITGDGKMKVAGLYPLEAKNIEVERFHFQKNGLPSRADIKYLSEITGMKYTYKPFDLMIATDSINGLIGDGVLKAGQEIFAKALVEIKQSRNYFERNGVPLGALETDQRLNDEQVKDVRMKFAEKYQGADNAGEILILQGGLKYKPLQPMTLDNTKERDSINEEICKLFGVPYSKIHNKNDGNGKSLEENNKAFLQDCLNPIIENIEAAINYTLLTEREKEQGYYFRFDVSELERASHKEQMETIVAGVQAGIFSINEARAKLDLPKHDEDYTAFAPGTTMINSKGELVGQGLNQTTTSANDSGDDSNTGVDVDE